MIARAQQRAHEALAACILNDPDEQFQTTIDYLVAAGHRDLIYVSQVTQDSAAQLNTHGWRLATAALFNEDEANARCIGVHTPLFQCPTHDAYDAVRDFLSKGTQSVSAFVSFGEEITQGVLAAIRDSGMNVPEDISVINILDGPSMRFAHPPVTSIDVNFKRQFEIALEILEAAQQGVTPEQKNYFVDSRVIERQSVISKRSLAVTRK